jgi:hypothetical protein
MDVPMILGLVVCALAGAAVLGLLGIALRNTLNDPQRKQEARARRAHVADLQAGETVLLVGQVKPSEELLTAPFSGRCCVGYRAAIENDVSLDDPDEVLVGIARDRLPPTMLLKDESGAVLVRLASTSTIAFDRGQREVFREVPMATVDALLAQWGASYDDIEHGFPFGVSYARLPVDYRAVEWLLHEGDQVAVVGQVAEEPAAMGKTAFRLVVGAEGALAARVIARRDEVAQLTKQLRRMPSV